MINHKKRSALFWAALAATAMLLWLVPHGAHGFSLIQ